MNRRLVKMVLFFAGLAAVVVFLLIDLIKHGQFGPGVLPYVLIGFLLIGVALLMHNRDVSENTLAGKLGVILSVGSVIGLIAIIIITIAFGKWLFVV
jgi:hypothetical protein